MSRSETAPGEATPMPGLKIGYLPQEPVMNPDQTVRQAVEEGIGGVLAATLLLVGYSYASDRIAQTLSFLDLIVGARSLAFFAVGITLCGLVFGAVGALMGLQRYLRQV